MSKMLCLLAVSLTLAALVPAVRADPILQPAAASTNMGTFGGTSPDNTRNQSGLSVGYTSLTTDFDTYIASNPTSDSASFTTNWISANGVLPPGNFDFSLGGTFTVESFALWNLGSNLPQNILDFDLLASADSTFSSPTSLGSFTANPNTGNLFAVLPEVFTFAPTPAAFVRMRITSNVGNTNTVFGEAAFEVQSPAAVPEPATLALLGLSLAGLGWSRRRK